MSLRPTQALATIAVGEMASDPINVSEAERGSFTVPKHFPGKTISFQVSGSQQGEFADLCGRDGKQVLINVAGGFAYPLPKETFSALFCKLVSNEPVTQPCVFSVSLRG